MDNDVREGSGCGWMNANDMVRAGLVHALFSSWQPLSGHSVVMAVESVYEQVAKKYDRGVEKWRE